MCILANRRLKKGATKKKVRPKARHSLMFNTCAKKSKKYIDNVSDSCVFCLIIYGWLDPCFNPLSPASRLNVCCSANRLSKIIAALVFEFIHFGLSIWTSLRKPGAVQCPSVTLLLVTMVTMSVLSSTAMDTTSSRWESEFVLFSFSSLACYSNSMISAPGEPNKHNSTLPTTTCHSDGYDRVSVPL